MPSATGSTTINKISWGSSDVSVRYFDIYRRPDNVTASITTADVVAKAGFGSDHYDDPVDRGKYWYWVKAISWAGNESGFSDTITAEYTQAVDGEPTGLPNRNDTVISWNDGTRTFSISPSATLFNYYIKGEKFTVTAADTIVPTNTTGMTWFYYDSAILTSVSNPSDATSDILIRDNALLGMIYWSTATNTSVYFGDERHGIQMDGSTHSYLHFVFGLQYIDGLAPDGITADQSGNLDPHAQFGVGAGGVTDEDIFHAITSVSRTVGLNVMYRNGVGGPWEKTTNVGFSILTTGTGRMAYNQNIAGTWGLAENTNVRFALCHVFSSTEHDDPLFAIVGQHSYATQGTAREGATTEINDLLLGDLPSPEIRPIATFIFQTSNAYGNAVKSRVRTTDTGEDYVDWRTSEFSRGAGASDHGSLAGLSDDDHAQYLLLAGRGGQIIDDSLTICSSVTLSSYADMLEISVPANPAATHGRLYVAETAGTTTLFFRDSAGTETNLLSGGGGGNAIYIEENTNPEWNTSGAAGYLNFGTQFLLTTNGQSSTVSLASALSIDTLNVSGSVSVGTTLHVSGATTLGGTLTVSGTITGNSGMTLNANSQINGSLELNGPLYVTSTITLSGNISPTSHIAQDIGGLTCALQTVYAETIGNPGGITYTSNLYPSFDDTWNLGGVANRWSKVYSDEFWVNASAYLDGVTASVITTNTCLDIKLITTPGNPPATYGRFYVADNGGTDTLYFRDSGGTETNLLSGGGGFTTYFEEGGVAKIDNATSDQHLNFDGSDFDVTVGSGESATVTLADGLVLNGGLTVSGTVTVEGTIIPASDSTYNLGAFAGPTFWQYLFCDRWYADTTAYIEGSGGGVIQIPVGFFDVTNNSHFGDTGSYNANQVVRIDNAPTGIASKWGLYVLNRITPGSADGNTKYGVGGFAQLENTNVQGTVYGLQFGPYVAGTTGGNTALTTTIGIQTFAARGFSCNYRANTAKGLEVLTWQDDFGGNVAISELTGIDIKNASALTGSAVITSLYGQTIEQMTRGTTNKQLILEGSCTAGDTGTTGGHGLWLGTTQAIGTNGTQMWVNGLTVGTGTNFVKWNSTGKLITYQASSRRYKENIEDFNDDWDNILRARPRTFSFKGEGIKTIGYIAEEFEEVGLNSLVTYNDKGQPENIEYEKIVIYLKEIVNVQQETIDKLLERVETLERKETKKTKEG